MQSSHILTSANYNKWLEKRLNTFTTSDLSSTPERHLPNYSWPTPHAPAYCMLLLRVVFKQALLEKKYCISQNYELFFIKVDICFGLFPWGLSAHGQSTPSSAMERMHVIYIHSHIYLHGTLTDNFTFMWEYSEFNCIKEPIFTYKATVSILPEKCLKFTLTKM